VYSQTLFAGRADMDKQRLRSTAFRYPGSRLSRRTHLQDPVRPRRMHVETAGVAGDCDPGTALRRVLALATIFRVSR